MRLSALKYAVVALSAAGITAAGLPMATAGAAGATAAGAGSARIGDRCLVGTWRDHGGRTSTNWNGHKVTMHSRGGDFDHISASGVDHDSWHSSKPLVGRFQHHRITERIRGFNTLLLRTHGRPGHRSVTMSERGWSAHSRNTFVYRGKRSTGYLSQSGRVSVGFRCSLTTLTFLSRHGHVIGRETRVSFKP